MLYFSKIKLFLIYFTIILLSFFFFINFIDNRENSILSKKINLGLDLQGGSYLLLEVESDVLISEELENLIEDNNSFFIVIKENKIDSIMLETKNKLKNVYERSDKSLYSHNVSFKK